MGGKRLWRNRNRLADAGQSETEWRQGWDAARIFLTADGETGKTGGNETIRVTPATGQLRIKVPAALADQFGTHLSIAAAVVFHHRREEWRDRIERNRAVRYDIVFDPTRRRWYLDASWSVAPTASVEVSAIRTGRVLGVDLNDGYLATCALDKSGNPVGEPATIAVARQGLPASQRDGHLRAAITALLDRAEHSGCAAIVIENLDFDDARSAGRETMGRGQRGKRFRRTVASIPTAKFRERLRGMAAQHGITVMAVDPAYTSKAGRRCWRKPLQQQAQTSGYTVTTHHGAAVAIGRRGLGFKLSRHSNGPRNAQRSVTGQPSSLATVSNRVCATCEKPCPTPGPEVRPKRSGSKHHTSAAKTVRAATEQYSLSLTN
jgi:IS605 OrfB family transposase